MIQISCQHSEILQALRRINSVVLKSKRARNDYMLSLNLKINSIEIIGQGLTIYIDGNTDSFGVVSIPFLIMWRFVQDWKEDNFQLQFDNVKVKCGNRTIESPFIKITHPENFPKSDLTMNPSKLEMLALKKQYSQEDLRKLNLESKLDKAETELYDAISQTMFHLRDYGVTPDELHHIINEKIKSTKPKIDHPRILIVDDDETLCKILSEQLEYDNFFTKYVLDGFNAIKEIKIENYNLVIVDLNMIRMNGDQLLSEIKLYDSTIPVIMLSAHADPVMIVKCIKLGVDYYITKPYDYNELLNTIKTYIN